jgi:putative hydrolase of the HAD superfamily
MIEAVTFDFWETLMQDSAENLRRNRDLRIDGLRLALAEAGFDRPREALAAAHDAAGERITALWRRGADAATREQVRLLLECLEPGLAGALEARAWAALEEAYATPALSHMPQARDGAGEALWALRQRGVRIGLISNTGRTPGRVLRMILQRAGLLEHFDGLTFSDEVGIRKPDARIFRWTLNKLGARAEAAAHVGDNLAADVGGAQAAGLRGIHLVNGVPPPAADPGVDDPGVHADASIVRFADLVPALERFGLPGSS